MIQIVVGCRDFKRADFEMAHFALLVAILFLVGWLGFSRWPSGRGKRTPVAIEHNLARFAPDQATVYSKNLMDAAGHFSIIKRAGVYAYS